MLHEFDMFGHVLFPDLLRSNVFTLFATFLLILPIFVADFSLYMFAFCTKASFF